MAKQKGGLGRGLSSLLGNELDGNLPQESASPVERIVIEAERERRAAQAKPQANVSSPAKQDDKLTSGNQTTHGDKRAPHAKGGAGLSSGDEIYSSKEDNVTIKGVVERAVRPAASSSATSSAASASATAKPAQPGAPKTTQQEGPRGTQPGTINRDHDEVPIDQVQPNPDQPRTSFKKEELEELAESIKRNGLLQPILVRKVGASYQIIAGERRWQACKLLGLKTVPIRIRDVDDEETIILALVENIQRSDLNPIEEAYGYRRMMERGNMTQSQVAQAVSKGRSTIANALRLLELPEEAQQLLFEEQITAGHARAILSIPTKEGRDKLTEQLVKTRLSVRETESIARLLSGKKDGKPVERPKVPKSYKTVARALRETLQTDVHVRSAKGKNKIEIAFKDEADLERLYRIISSSDEPSQS